MDWAFFAGAAYSKGNQVNTALEVECQDLLMTIQHAWIKGFTKVIFEGHNKRFD